MSDDDQPAESRLLTDFGLTIPRELATEPAAIMAMIQATPAATVAGPFPNGPHMEFTITHKLLDPETAERVALKALSPQRAAQKRQVIKQRRAREGRQP